MKRSEFALVLLLVLLMCGTNATATDGATKEVTAPLFDDLGDYHFPITTSSPDAQKYFDQGLILSYAFNHAESARSFREAQRLDPNCAMCFWGEALVLGPNINKPMDPSDNASAYRLVGEATQRISDVSAVEKSLIEALATRYSESAKKDRASLDATYATAMRRLSEIHPESLEVNTLAAEAIMDTMPWDYYEADGSPKPDTLAATSLLEEVLRRNPNHAGAIHLYIHIVEPSATPQRAEAAADRLGELAPGAGHLVHMPSHIYLRVGRYADASAANERAALADESYIAQCRAQGFYPALYYPHNVHFLWYSASMEGRSKVALDAAQKLVQKVPKDMLDKVPFLQSFGAAPYFGLIRFAKWDEILSLPKPDGNLEFIAAMWHASRSVAALRLGKSDLAQNEMSAFREMVGQIVSSKVAYGFPAAEILDIAGRFVEAEHAVIRKDYAAAENVLAEAVVIEDGLKYTEPPYWYFPMRQYLGAVQLQRGEYVSAEQTYRIDLRKNPRNGWSMKGLIVALRGQGRTSQANDVAKEYVNVWSEADIELKSSRL